jgi:hypothetical protein
MKPVPAFALAFGSAAAAPALEAAIVLLVGGELFEPLGLVFVGAVLACAIAIVLVCGVPTVLLLKHFHKLEFRWVALTAFVGGALGPLLIASLPPLSSDDFSVEASALRVAIGAVFFGTIGLISALCFWFVLERAMRPNTSLERTREG